MRYWLFTFRPDTYEKVVEHSIVGVRHSARRIFSQIKKGDRFVVYVTRKKIIDGHGEFVSAPFEEDTALFSEHEKKRYKHRCRVRFHEVDKGIPAGDVLWFLSPFAGLDNTSPTNILFCKGGFVELNQKDFSLLSELKEAFVTPEIPSV